MHERARGLERDATATIGDMTLQRQPHFTAIASDAESAMYRFIGPLRAMIEAGLATGDVSIGMAQTVGVTPDSLLVISSRIDLATIADASHTARIVIDIDEVPAAFGRIEKHLARADAIVVSTETLNVRLRDRGFAPHVLPHVLDPRDWTARPKNDAHARPRIGWYGERRTVANQTAFRDAIVRSLIDDVDFIFLGTVPQAPAEFAGRLQVAATVPLALFPAQLAALDLDLVLVPPVADDPPGAHADHLPALQAGILGYAVVAADVAAFRSLPVTRIGSDRPAAWTATIRERIADRRALRHEGEILRSATRQNFLAGAWAERYFAAWSGTNDAIAGA